MIHIGCSGWNYKDWIGKLYPVGTRDMLSFYSSRFDTVEINTTFYNIPDPKVIGSWIQTVSNKKPFFFSVKFPKLLTHDLFFKDFEACVQLMEKFEKTHLQLFASSGKLGAVLIQMPPYFKEKHLENLLSLLSGSDHEKFRYFVEVRRKELYYNKALRKNLGKIGIGIVEIDSPEKIMENLGSNGDKVYIRFHGRNIDSWEKPDSPSSRYEYYYSQEELRNFRNMIIENRDKYKEIFIYFNNHPKGNAPNNALELREMLDIPDRQPDFQKTLF